jgi:hypothetical protein
MNNDNFDYLKDQVKMTGFGEKLESQLKENMQKLEPEFQLQHQVKHGEKEMNYTLNFKKSTTQDNYFFNSFEATLKIAGKDDLSNTFYANQRVTAKEAYNLLEGRSVEKKYNHQEKISENIYKPIKDSTYNQWLKIDFNDADEKGNFKMKSFGEKWGFDLEKKVAELPIKQLQNADDKTDLLNSLKKGNIQSVTFEQAGKTENRYVEANPRARSINVYDSKMQLIQDPKQAKNITPAQSESKDQKQSQSQKQDTETPDDAAKEGKKPKKKKGQGVS